MRRCQARQSRIVPFAISCGASNSDLMAPLPLDFRGEKWIIPPCSKKRSFGVMRILIIGAGNTGSNLAEKFCQDGHDVVVIDKSAEALSEIETQLDILAIKGAGASPRILEEAGVARAGLVVAVTDHDETNILACILAHTRGVEKTVARVSESAYMGNKDYDLSRMGVDLLINQKNECAQDLYNVIRLPGTLEVVDMLDERVLAVGMTVHMDSPLVLGPLKSFPESRWLNVIRFIAFLRGDEVKVPHGDTQFIVGDDIYFAGKMEDIAEFMAWAWPENARFQKVIIAGGGNLGMHLARLLEKTNMQTILLENKEDKAAFCSEQLQKALVVKGNAIDQETLQGIGITENTAYIAATGNDENNIIGCLVANKLGVRFTAAQVDKPEYVPIINSLSLLDRAVNPHLSMINAILHFVRGKNVKAAAMLHRLPGELIEVVLSATGKWSGKQIKNLHMPEGAVIASVLREEEILVPTGALKLLAGDRVVVYCLPEATPRLESVFET